MKHLLILLLAASAHAQLLPVTPAERALADIDRAAAASRYYGELYAQSLSTLHAKIFGLDDATLKSVLERLGEAQSEQLLTLYVSSATGEWVWSADTVTITPLPDPVAAP
jgi:hypothetical protein